MIEGGARNVFAAAEASGGQRVVLVSSTAAVNGSDAPRLFDETSEFTLAGENVTIRRLAELVLEIAGRRAPMLRVPTGLVRAVARIGIGLSLPLPFDPHVIPYATRYWFVDNAKARRELGVTFRGARATIESTLEWLAETTR